MADPNQLRSSNEFEKKPPPKLPKKELNFDLFAIIQDATNETSKPPEKPEKSSATVEPSSLDSTSKPVNNNLLSFIPKQNPPPTTHPPRTHLLQSNQIRINNRSNLHQKSYQNIWSQAYED